MSELERRLAGLRSIPAAVVSARTKLIPQGVSIRGPSFLDRLRRLSRLAARVQINNPLDRPATYGAESRVIPREHDTVDLRPVVPLGLVHSPFECAHAARIFFCGEHCCLVLLLFVEKGVHYGLRLARGPYFSSAFLNSPRVLLVFLLAPWSRYRGARTDQVFPLQIGWIEQRSDVRLPGFHAFRRLSVCDRRGVVFIRQCRKVMSEFMD